MAYYTRVQNSSQVLGFRSKGIYKNTTITTYREPVFWEMHSFYHQEFKSPACLMIEWNVTDRNWLVTMLVLKLLKTGLIGQAGLPTRDKNWFKSEGLMERLNKSLLSNEVLSVSSRCLHIGSLPHKKTKLISTTKKIRQDQYFNVKYFRKLGYSKEFCGFLTYLSLEDIDKIEKYTYEELLDFSKDLENIPEKLTIFENLEIKYINGKE